MLTIPRFLYFAVLCDFFIKINGQTILCPVPGDPSDFSQGDCFNYDACYLDGDCLLRPSNEIGYVVASEPTTTQNGLTVQLSRMTTEYTMFGDDIENLTFEVIFHEDYHLQIKITDTNNHRYEVPVQLNFPTETTANPMYNITISENGQPFKFTITRKSNKNVIFDMVGPLIYENQFIQFTTTLLTEYLYGFGESTHTTFKRSFDETCAMFARDEGISTELKNEYGHHPYYMAMEDDEGNSHSVFYFNSNAMEYNTFMDGITHMLTLRTIGGIIDLHFLLGPTPEDVNVQYTQMVGKPLFPSYYMLGFQLSRWGYPDLNNVQEIHEEMMEAGVPQDIQVFDIDYMYQRRDFTYDTVLWAGLPEFIEELHNETLKVTLILDPAISTDFDNYPPGDHGRDMDVYITWPEEWIPSNQPDDCKDYVVGKVWPGQSVFPDFFNPNTSIWWLEEMLSLYEDLNLKFDAMWIDMNEPANFDTDRDGNATESDWILKCPNNNLEDPPYPTATIYTGSSISNRISDHTICMTSEQTDGTNVYSHYDVHSLYGLSHLRATYSAMVEMFPGKRPMILIRSTYPTAGQYGVHWLGDNNSEFSNMAMSIVGMMEFNMFGIPYVGADVCGFFGDATEELCGRWTALGAFYPFNRNHNHEASIDQHPTVWPSVTEIAIKYLNLRYKYNPYLYDLFYRAHINGGSVVRPLLNNFPSDLMTRDISDQFMWSDGLMIAPILEEQTFARNIYFPQGFWYDLINGTLEAVGPTTRLVPVPINEIPVYVKGGKILPYQEPAMTTTLSRLNPFGLTVALGETGSANGEIFWDDGKSIYDKDKSFLAELNFISNTLTMIVYDNLTLVEDLRLETIEFFGYPSVPTAITANGGQIDPLDWLYDDVTRVLDVSLDVPLNADLSLVIS